MTPVQFIRGRRVKDAMLNREPKPEWLKVRAPGSANYLRLRGLMRELKLHTVCEEAHCPNIGECWHHGTATFMIMGDVCTRACGYCNVRHGAPAGPRPGRTGQPRPRRRDHGARLRGRSPRSTATTCRTSAPAFSPRPSARFKARRPECRVEVLIPDFQGREAPLRTVLEAGPDVLNHNTETVPRCTGMARPGGQYHARLELLDRARQCAPAIPTKTGLMVGLGETLDEIVEVLRDLRAVDCQILTIGQYLRPSLAHLPMVALLHARRIPGSEADRPGPRLRPRRIGSARALLVPRARTGRQLRRRT